MKSAFWGDIDAFIPYGNLSIFSVSERRCYNSTVGSDSRKEVMLIHRLSACIACLDRASWRVTDHKTFG